MDQPPQTNQNSARKLWAWLIIMVPVLFLGMAPPYLALQSRVNSLESKLRDLESKVSSGANWGEINRLRAESVHTEGKISQLQADLQEIRKKIK